VLKSLLPIRPVSHTGWTYFRISLIHHTCLVPYPGFREVSRTYLALSPDMFDLSALTQVKSLELDMSGSKADFQRDFLDISGLRLDRSSLKSYMSDELYDHCNLNSTGLVRPFSGHVRVLTQLCHLREISSVSGLSRFGVFIPV
jgi:hypothetical protein